MCPRNWFQIRWALCEHSWHVKTMQFIAFVRSKLREVRFPLRTVRTVWPAWIPVTLSTIDLLAEFIVIVFGWDIELETPKYLSQVSCGRTAVLGIFSWSLVDLSLVYLTRYVCTQDTWLWVQRSRPRYIWLCNPFLSGGLVCGKSFCELF